MVTELFDCDLCGRPVLMSTGPGRYRCGTAVPDDLPVATCQGCGETYLTTAEAEALDGH